MEQGEQVSGEAVQRSDNKGKSSLKSNLSATAPEFIPRITPTAHFNYMSEVNIGARGDGTEHTTLHNPVDRLKELMTSLTANPASCEEGLDKVAQDFNNTIKDEETLKNCVSELVDYCIDEANFRYTGARISQAFCSTVKVQFPSGNFRQHLLKRIHSEHQQRAEMAKTPSGKKRLVGLTIFMGELLRQLRVEATKERYKILATAVEELATTCLDNPEELTVKNAIQVLKLCGPIVHRIEKDGNSEKKTPKLDALIGRLKHLAVEDTWSRNLKTAMLNLIEEHVKWDELPEPTEEAIVDVVDVTATTSQTHSQKSHQEMFSNEPVFYNAAGQVISAEEAGFAGGEYNDGYLGYDPYAYEGDFSPDAFEHYIEGENDQDSGEWDDEIDTAFEEFLLNQQNEAHNTDHTT